MRVWTTLALTLAASVLLNGCSNGPAAEEWGAATEQYFAEWSDAWAAGDAYNIARFYDPDIEVVLAQDYRSLSLGAGYRGTAVGGDGRVWLVDWIEAQYESRERAPADIFVGSNTVITYFSAGEINTAAAVLMRMDDSLIDEYTDLRWRDAHLDGGRPDPRLQWLDDLVDEHVASLTSSPPIGDVEYVPDATVEAFPDPAVTADDVFASQAFVHATVAELRTGSRVGRAVFVVPEVAAYVLETEASDGCLGEYMVILELDGRSIAAEKRLPSIDTVRRCLDDPPDGWWNTLPIPSPVGEQVTGVITERDGTEITVFNGTPELEQLLIWGLERFEQAGLVRPNLRTASFAPLPVCRGIPGVVVGNGDEGSDLVLCTDSQRACEPNRDACDSFATGARLGLLHELGHAWLIENLDEDSESEFLTMRDLEVWSGESAAWHERGSEQAAEIVAWGLIDEDLLLVRIGSPSCESAAAGFRVLTGIEPLREC